MLRVATAAIWVSGRLLTNLTSGLSNAGSGTEASFMIAVVPLLASDFAAVICIVRLSLGQRRPSITVAIVPYAL